MIPVARIQGIPRARNRCNLNPAEDLQSEIQNYTRTVKMYAPVGVIGLPKTGKKTLAYRFERIGEGTFDQEVPFKYVYVRTIEGKFHPPETNRQFVLNLKFYIINSDRFPPYAPPIGSGAWSDFCCIVAVFDISKTQTFLAVPEYIHHMTHNGFYIQPNFFIVGNKSDLRRSRSTRGRSEVSVETAERMVESLEGTYFECSAKKPENVWPILEAIKNAGAKPQYRK